MTDRILRTFRVSTDNPSAFLVFRKDQEVEVVLNKSSRDDVSQGEEERAFKKSAVHFEKEPFRNLKDLPVGVVKRRGLRDSITPAKDRPVRVKDALLFDTQRASIIRYFDRRLFGGTPFLGREILMDHSIRRNGPVDGCQPGFACKRFVQMVV